MTPKDALLICTGAIGFLIALTAVMENTERGQRIIARLLAHFLGEPEVVKPSIYRCCIEARSGRTEAGYYLHRVREHGDGA